MFCIPSFFTNLSLTASASLYIPLYVKQLFLFFLNIYWLTGKPRLTCSTSRAGRERLDTSWYRPFGYTCNMEIIKERHNVIH
jgi:hypothetical protein